MALQDPWEEFPLAGGQDAKPASATAAPSGAPVTADDYQVNARAPDGKLGADEVVVFGDEEAPKTGPRFTPDQEAQLRDALLANDPARVKQLAQQFSGGKVSFSDEAIQKYGDWLRANPGEAFGVDYAPTDQSAEKAYNREIYRGFDEKPIDELRQNDVLPETADAFARGGALGMDDEIDAIVSTALHGGSFEDNFARAKAIKKYDEENHATARFAGGMVGSLLLPTRVAGVARPAAMAAYQDARAIGLGVVEARALAQAAARRALGGQMAREGAVYGGAIGGAEGDTTGERLAGASGGAALGAATGRALPELGRLSRNAGPRPAATQGQRTLQAADRLGIDVLPADVSGPMVRRLTGGLAQSSIAGPQITNASLRNLDQSQAALNAVRDRFGQALNLEASGQRAVDSAERFIDRTSTRANQLYRAAEGLAGDARVRPTEALAALNRNITELAEVPGGVVGAERLTALREALEQGTFSVAGMRGMRSVLRDEFASSGLRGSDIERRVNQVVDASAADIEHALAQRPGALRAFQLANRYWRARIRDIDEAITPIIGKEGDNSGVRVVRNLEAAMKGNSPRLFRFMNTLDPQERSQVTATLINQLGRSTKGAQNAEGDAFSLQTFLSNWKDAGDSLGEGGKRRLFGPEGATALNDLARVAEGSRLAQGYANRSNTGSANWAIFNFVTTLPTIGANLLSQYGMGRLLSSPRFARWLARAPRTQLNQAAYIDRLSRIARAEPVIANDILQLQRRLSEAFAGSAPARLAAEEPVDATAGVREQQQQDEDYPGQEIPQ